MGNFGTRVRFSPHTPLFGAHVTYWNPFIEYGGGGYRRKGWDEKSSDEDEEVSEEEDEDTPLIVIVH